MKSKVLKTLKATLQDKIDSLQIDIKSSEEARNSDTKSSAGDKHETSRAMAQIEIDKLKQQLAIASQQYQTIAKINSEQKHIKAGFGSLISTQNATYFIAIAMGKILVDDTSIFCISINAPIGEKLAGKSVGESFEFNGQSQQITSLN